MLMKQEPSLLGMSECTKLRQVMGYNTALLYCKRHCISACIYPCVLHRYMGHSHTLVYSYTYRAFKTWLMNIKDHNDMVYCGNLQ